MKSSFPFRIALVLNGIGSVSLAFAFPFYLAADFKSGFIYYFLQGIVFLASAFGMLFWGQKLDQSTDIWKFKLKIILAECVITVVFFAAVLLDVTNTVIAIVIALLEFLFTFEIPWSRIAYYELPANKNKTDGELSQEIILTAAFVSILAPTCGAFFGSLKNLILLAMINLVSFIPYAVVSFLLARRKREACIPPPDEAAGGIRTGSRSFRDFLRLVKRDKKMTRILWGISILHFGLSVILVSMPILLYRELMGRGPWAIPLFFLISGLITVVFNSKPVRDKYPRVLTEGFSLPGCGLLLSGIVYFFTANFILKLLAFCAYDILWIGINIYITGIFYSQEHKKIRARLFSLLQFFARFTTPLVSVLMAVIPQSQDTVVVSLVFGFFSLAGVLIFMPAEIKAVCCRDL